MVESTSSPSDTGSLDQALAYCADQVKQYDRDRYTICAGVPPDVRGALFALYAFNLEIAKTREIVSEPMLGQIRLQWWRDALEEIYQGTPRNHAVVQALAAAIERHKPPRERFDRLINAREFDLEDSQPETVADLVTYSEATSGELNCLVLHMVQEFNDILFQKTKKIGAAWALNGLIYAIPFHAAQGRCYLPRDLTDKYGVSIDKLFTGSGDANLCRAVADLADLAQQHLECARPDGTIKGHPAFAGLPVVTADLKRLKKARYDVFAVRPTGPFRRRWLLISGLR